VVRAIAATPGTNKVLLDSTIFAAAITIDQIPIIALEFFWRNSLPLATFFCARTIAEGLKVQFVLSPYLAALKASPSNKGL